MQYAYKNGKILNGTKEMHVHLAGNGKPQKKQRDNAKLVKTLMSNGISRAIAYRMVAGFAKDELLSGVTTIRTVGGLGTFDTRLRDEIKAGKRQARESLPQMRESSTVRKSHRQRHPRCPWKRCRMPVDYTVRLLAGTLLLP